MEYNADDLAKFVIKDNCLRSLKECYQTYGLEGTEEKIRDLYSRQPTIMHQLLYFHQQILRKEISNGI